MDGIYEWEMLSLGIARYDLVLGHFGLFVVVFFFFLLFFFFCYFCFFLWHSKHFFSSFTYKRSNTVGHCTLIRTVFTTCC